jgi:flagellar biosynthesis/type III secretory pathway chaperone
MTEMTLSSILREIESVFDQLIHLAEQKAEMIVSGDVSGLDEIVAKEEDASRNLAALEEDRARLAGSVAQDDPEVERLRHSLRGKADKMKILNERNQELLRQGLRLVEFELKLLMPQPSYNGAPAKGPVLFDHKV